MGRDRRADVEVGYKVDKSSAREVERENKRLSDSVKEIQSATDSLSKQRSNRGLDSLANDAKQATREVDRLEDALKRARAANDRFDDVSRGVGLAGDVQSNLGALSGLAGAAGAGGLSSGISGIGEAVVLIEELPRLKAAVSGLPQTVKAAGAALGPVGVGLGAAVVGLGIVAAVAARRIERAQQVLKGTTDAFREFERFRLDATTDEARQKLEDLEKELQSVNTTLATLQRAGEAAAETNPALGALINRFGGYAETIRGLEDEQQVLTQQVGLYTGALENNVFAVGDAARAQQEYTQSMQNFVDTAAQAGVSASLFLSRGSTSSDDVDQRIADISSELDILSDVLRNNQAISETYRDELTQRQASLTAELNTLNAGRSAVDQRTAALQLQADIEANSKELIEANARAQELANRFRLEGINEQINREREYARLTRDATTGATADRLTALNDEQKALQSLIAELEPIAGDSEEFAMALANARDDLRRVNSDIERTFGDVAPAAIQRLAQTIQDDIAKAGIDRNSAIRDAGLTRAKGLQDAARALNDGLADLDRDFARQQAEYQQENLAELDQFQRDERDRVRNHQKELARIQRDAQDTIQDAALSLDASGVRRARRERDRQLEDAQERFELESEQAQERLELIKKEAEAERRELIQNYQDRRRDLLQANQQTVNDLNQRYRAEIQTAQSAYTTQVNLLQQKLQAETNLISQAYSAQLQGAQQFAQQSAQLAQQTARAAQEAQRAAQVEAGKQRVSNVVQGVASTGFGSSLSNIFGGLLGFADGGRVPYDGIFQLHKDEIVLNRSQQQSLRDSMRGGRNMSINIPITVQGNLDNVTLGQVRSEINNGINEFIDRVSA